MTNRVSLLSSFTLLVAVAVSLRAEELPKGKQNEPPHLPKYTGQREADARAARWTIHFKTDSGKEYLEQLSALGATIVMPQPKDWKKNNLITDLSKPNAGAPHKETDPLPELLFIDDDKASAKKLAQALGLDFEPPYVIATLPKRVEEDLALKELAYQKLKVSEIKGTTFRVEKKNDKWMVVVTDQNPKKAKREKDRK